MEGGNDPVWNVTFRLPLNRKVEQSGVQVTVWHKSSGTKPPELLGGIRLVSKLGKQEVFDYFCEKGKPKKFIARPF